MPSYQQSTVARKMKGKTVCNNHILSRIGQPRLTVSDTGRTLDFNIESAGVTPLYAVSFDAGPLSIILRTESSMAELTFNRVKELLQFQWALTGFRSWENYSQ